MIEVFCENCGEETIGKLLDETEDEETVKCNKCGDIIGIIK